MLTAAKARKLQEESKLKRLLEKHKSLISFVSREIEHAVKMTDLTRISVPIAVCRNNLDDWKEVIDYFESLGYGVLQDGEVWRMELERKKLDCIQAHLTLEW